MAGGFVIGPAVWAPGSMVIEKEMLHIPYHAKQSFFVSGNGERVFVKRGHKFILEDMDEKADRWTFAVNIGKEHEISVVLNTSIVNTYLVKSLNYNGIWSAINAQKV